MQFNMHKDGTITDLVIVAPCPIPAFNSAAFGAFFVESDRAASAEYPADKAFFTVTFYYNESHSRPVLLD